MKWKDIKELQTDNLRTGDECLLEQVYQDGPLVFHEVGHYDKEDAFGPSKPGISTTRYCVIQPKRKHQLRPCPFPRCGSEDLSIRWFTGLEGNVVCVQCNACCTRGPKKLTRGEAEAAWGYQD